MQEYSKTVFQSEDTDHQKAVRQILYMVTDTFLRALSPFMPFLTEELFQRLPAKGSNWPESVCIAPYPQPQDVRMCLVVSLCELKDVFWGLFLHIKALLYHHMYSVRIPACPSLICCSYVALHEVTWCMVV